MCEILSLVSYVAIVLTLRPSHRATFRYAAVLEWAVERTPAGGIKGWLESTDYYAEYVCTR